MQYNECFTKIVYTNDEIVKKINELAVDINSYYRSLENEEILVIGVLEGSLVFCGHILPKMDFNLVFKTVKVSVYGSKTFARKEDLIFETHFDPKLVKGKKVLILEDLLDTGMTLGILKDKLFELGATDIKICVLFKKLLKNQEQIFCDWVGLTIPNEWVAGFGIDSRNKYRNYKHLGIVKIEKR